MTQYLLSVIHDWDALGDTTPEEMQEMFEATGRFNEEIEASGHWVFGGGLEHPSTATVVDGAKGANVVSDGPYLEAKEHLGGFWVIEAADLDEAIELGRRASAACARAVEVRPFQSE
ncbi:MAG: YciI family protein [Propionibacteriales bacterium]|nr:YciI family protein [Propionibacteriales bacterium]